MSSAGKLRKPFFKAPEKYACADFMDGPQPENTSGWASGVFEKDITETKQSKIYTYIEE
jgi:hypothetical protein